MKKKTIYYILSLICVLVFIAAWFYREKFMFYDLIFGLLAVTAFEKARGLQ